MKIIAKRSVQLRGHIYSKGEAAEWDGPVDSRIAANFTAEDGGDLRAADGGDRPSGEKKDGKKDGAITTDRIDRLVKELGRRGIEQKLDELGVTYRPNMNSSQMALLLLQQQGEV